MRVRLIGLFLLFAALASSSLGQDRRGGPSLDRVLPQISRSVPGTFYDAEGPFLAPDGQASYRIKWMTPEGRIIWFSVNARTGQVIGAPPSSGAPYRGSDRREEPNTPPRNNWQDDRDGWTRGQDANRNGRNRSDWNGWNRDRPDGNRDRDRPDWNRDRDRPEWNRDRDKQDWNRGWGRDRDSDRNGGRGDWGRNRDHSGWDRHDWNGGRDRRPGG